MAWEFRVGMKVVCINKDKWGPFIQHGETMPVFGGVYTIRGIHEVRTGDISLTFVEIRNPLYYDSGTTEATFAPKNFRPLRERKTDISIFRALLNTNEKKVEA